MATSLPANFVFVTLTRARSNGTIRSHVRAAVRERVSPQLPPGKFNFLLKPNGPELTYPPAGWRLDAKAIAKDLQTDRRWGYTNLRIKTHEADQFFAKRLTTFVGFLTNRILSSG